MSRLFALAACAAVLAWPAPAAESLSVLLQKAIYAEETEGNLESAIQLYEQIAADIAANRPLAAQALYRLAVCYEKQGKREQAIGVLNELLRQFPGETALAVKAREQLATLGRSSAESVTLRKVSTVNTTWFRGVSPRGRFAAFCGDNGEIFMQEPALGKTWLLLKCNWQNSPWWLVFSPDERRIAYDLAGTALYVSNPDGSEMREVYRPANRDMIWPLGWVGTSTRILVETEEGEKKTRALATVDELSGKLTQLKVPGIRLSGPRAASADGRYLAFREGNKLELLDLESGGRSTLVEDHVTGIFGWAHRDATLFFCSDRTGKNSLWLLPITAGQPAGEPRFVKEQSGETRFETVTADGRVYYTEDHYAANVWLAAVNFDTGELHDEPRLVTERFPGMQIAPAWSKDGGKLWLLVPGEQRRLVAVSMHSGKQDDVPLSLAFRPWLQRYAVSPDGTFALIDGQRLSRPGASNWTGGIHRLELATGKAETLRTMLQDDSARGVRLTADGRSFYYTRTLRDRSEDDRRKNLRTLVMRREIASGKEEVVCERAGERTIMPFNVSFSPDGSRLAFATSDVRWNEEFVPAIEVLDLKSGRASELLRLRPRERLSALDWTPDGRRLVYARGTATDGHEGGKSAIWSTEIESGRSVKLSLPFPNVDEAAIHPDGRQIAFRTGLAGDWGHLWVMEGVNPSQPISRERFALGKTVAQNPSGSVALGKLKGPNNTLFDPATGLRAVLPAGWEVTAATRKSENAVFGIELKVPDASQSTALISLCFDDPKNLSEQEAHAWLRSFAETDHLERRRSNGKFGGTYANRPGSFVTRRHAGRPALRWEGEFTRGAESFTELATLIYWERGFAAILFAAPANAVSRQRAAYEALVASILLPPAPTAQREVVPMSAICGPDNAIFDPNTGLRAILPACLKAQAAHRVPQWFWLGLAPANSRGRGQIRFEGNRMDIPPVDVDQWLRAWASTRQPLEDNWAVRVESFASRVINGHPALSYQSDFTMEFERWTELLTIIHHQNGSAVVTLQMPASAADGMRDAYEKLLASVQLP